MLSNKWTQDVPSNGWRERRKADERKGVKGVPGSCAPTPDWLLLASLLGTTQGGPPAPAHEAETPPSRAISLTFTRSSSQTPGSFPTFRSLWSAIVFAAFGTC